VADEARLEQTLSEPTPEVVEALSGLDGSILVLGAAGKMGPSLCRLARRGLNAAGSRHEVIAVARFSDPGLQHALERDGIRTIVADLLDRQAVDRLPDAPNVVHMVGQKFGTSGNESRTWAVNAVVPALVAQRFSAARIVVYSTGNVYPLSSCAGPGSREEDPTGPVGEYAQSALARERIFEFYSRACSTPQSLLRINYAIEPRYGVLRDLGDKVRGGEEIDLRMGWVNVIWQRDANAVALRALPLSSTPPLVLNVTGPAMSVRWLAEEFGKRLGVAPRFSGTEADTSLLSDASRMVRQFGPPVVSIDEMIRQVAEWIEQDGRSLNKPTRFESREGTF